VLPCATEAVIPVVALVNLLFGIGFALIARDRVKADGPFAAPAFQLVAMHAAGVVAPLALYFYAVHPAWAWMYWVDPDKLGFVSVIPLVAGHAALVIGGWYIASLLIRKGLQGALFYVGAFLALILMVLIIAGINRLGTAADFLGWQRKAGVSVFSVRPAGVRRRCSRCSIGDYIAIELVEMGGGYAADDRFGDDSWLVVIVVALAGQVRSSISMGDAAGIERGRRSTRCRADKYSPYYWTRATEYLRKARELAAHSDMQEANRYGRLATEAAELALEESTTASKDPTKRAAPAKEPGTTAPAKDEDKPVAPAKETP
jgi:hypothetical protein